jgi:hypothetical protein
MSFNLAHSIFKERYCNFSTISRVLKESRSRLLLFSFFLYSYLVSSSASPLKCRYSNGSYVMYDNPSTFCFDEDWKSNLGFVVFFCFLYGLGVPSLLFYVLFKNKDFLDSPEFLKRYGSLTTYYSPRFYWWELVPVGKRALFVLSASFLLISEAELTVLYGTQLFLFLFLFLEVACQPHKLRSSFISSIA